MKEEVIILATAYTQFGQEMALVMQSTHAQRWQSPDRVDKHLFSSIEMYAGITKILEFEYKTRVLKDTIMIYWDIWLHFQNLSGLCHPI